MQEEEEWQEVIAQNNSWQQQQADEQDANAAQDPSAELGAAAIDHAAASGAAASGAAANAVDAEAKGQAGNPGAGTGAEDTGPLPGLGKANADHRVCLGAQACCNCMYLARICLLFRHRHTGLVSLCACLCLMCKRWHVAWQVVLTAQLLVAYRNP